MLLNALKQMWTHLRQAMEEECADHVGGQNDIVFNTLAAYLSSKFDDKGPLEVEQILHDELTAVQELASWEEPLVSEGLWSPEDAAGEQTEMELKEDLWEAVCAANESASSKSTIRRFGAARVKGVPILDPPTVTSTNQLIREDQPYYIVAGFVKLFPLGQGYYWAHLQQRQEETLQPLSFWEWLKHLLISLGREVSSTPSFLLFCSEHGFAQQGIACTWVLPETSTNTSEQQHFLHDRRVVQNGEGPVYQNCFCV